jgi:hypothetical protein
VIAPELDDSAFDAAFGPLDLCGRSPAHWELLAEAVRDDVGGSATNAEIALPPLEITPPARLRPPRTARAARWARPAAVSFGLAMAAAALFRVATPEHGDPAALVPRGVVSSGAGALELDVAVVSADAGRSARLDPAGAYVPGDTLVFKVTLPAPATVALTRLAAGQTTTVWSGPVAAGTSALPTGYALDAGDAAARFVVLATLADGSLEAAVNVPAPRSAR